MRAPISATFKDIPGGQILGPTFDYTHRLLDFKLAADGEVGAASKAEALIEDVPHILELLNRDGLIQEEELTDAEPGDLTREPLALPAAGLFAQALARGDEGFCLGLVIQRSVVMPAITPLLASCA